MENILKNRSIDDTLDYNCKSDGFRAMEPDEVMIHPFQCLLRLTLLVPCDVKCSRRVRTRRPRDVFETGEWRWRSRRKTSRRAISRERAWPRDMMKRRCGYGHNVFLSLSNPRFGSNLWAIREKRAIRMIGLPALSIFYKPWISFVSLTIPHDCLVGLKKQPGYDFWGTAL